MSAIRFSSHKKFHLLQCKTRVWESWPELLSHYRIIFIMSGEGRFILDRKIETYSPKGIIFLKPDQHPVFQDDKDTEVFVIAFDTYLSDEFQEKKAFSPDFADTYKQLENLCNKLRLHQGRPLTNERECETISFLVNEISFEITQRPASHVKMVKGSIDLIVTILARNNFETKKSEERNVQQTLADSIIEHLRNQLDQNKSIRVQELLLHFNISEEVANLCVLNQTGMSLRNFIFKYKSDLFKSRLLKVDVREFSPYLGGVNRYAAKPGKSEKKDSYL